MPANQQPLRYAFDLGTNSIGWAVYRLDRAPRNNEPTPSAVELLGCGTRLFDDGRNPKDGRSLAEMRRVPRSARKRRDRFVMRRVTLIRQLIQLGLLPEDSDERRSLASLDPYALRAKGLDSRLQPFEIGRALLHINQRRGFQSNRRADRTGKADEKGKIASGVAALQSALANDGARTFGEFLWKRHGGADGSASPRTRQAVRIRLGGTGAEALYHYYPARQMLMDEFDALLDAQSRFHPGRLSAEVVADLRETIFLQRPLKPVAVGKCTFVFSEDRLPRALPSVEARIIYEMLNQLRFGEGLTLNRKLSPEHRDLYAATLMAGRNVTFKQMRKTLKLAEGVRFSLEDAGKSELKDYMARSGKLGGSECFGGRWFELPLNERDQIVLKLIDAEHEQEVTPWLKDTYKLAEEAVKAIEAWSPADGYARLGRTANDKVLAELKSVDLPSYAEAAKRAGWHHSDERDGIIELPLPYYGQVLERHVLFGSGNAEHAAEKRYGRFPNPTAHVALNQLRHVVNKLVQAYGEPSQIVIELARELKQTREQKEEDQRRNRANRTVKDRHRLILAEHKQIEAGENFLRLRLFEEQVRAGGGVALCPFSLKPIAISQLFSSDVEIEHLLPYSRTFDDGAANKVVCLRSANRFKRAKTPYQACSAPDPEAAKVFASWDSIVAAAQGLPSNKRWRFGPDAMERYERKERDFLTRQLNETRHLSRMARIYLAKACDPDQVYVTTGQLTAMLRARWGLNSIWRDHNRSAEDDSSHTSQRQAKGRNDHRHHAVDACTIGAIDRSLLQEMSKRAGRAEIEGLERITADVPEPFLGFRDAVLAVIDKVIVSMKPEHGTGGALHEDTAYGLVTNSHEAAIIGNLIYRKPLADLKAGEIDSVRDAHLRKQLQDLVAPLRDAKGKLTKENEKAFEAALTKFSGQSAPGRIQGVRRVRIGKAKTGELHIKNRQTGAVYKALLPGENHHIDIVQMRDGSWQGFAATVFDVNQKGWRPEWEVNKLGGKLVMRLHKGDAVEVDDSDGLRRIKFVHRLEISANRVRLVPHNEGGDVDKRHKDDADGLRWDLASFGRLKERNARKVAIDAIGRVKKVCSNV